VLTPNAPPGLIAGRARPRACLSLADRRPCVRRVGYTRKI
jgi:hypothetical protein